MVERLRTYNCWLLPHFPTQHCRRQVVEASYFLPFVLTSICTTTTNVITQKPFFRRKKSKKRKAQWIAINTISKNIFQFPIFGVGSFPIEKHD